MTNNMTSQDKVNTYKTTIPLLKSMYVEFKELSKKKSDSAINKSKIRVANRLLEKVRIVLENEETLEFLDLFDEDDIPQTGDVTLMLSQYVAAMEGFQKKYHGYTPGLGHHWKIQD